MSNVRIGDSGEIIVLPSKAKCVLTLAGCLAFVSVAILFLVLQDQLKLPVLVLVASYISMPFFLLSGAYALRKLVTMSPSLVIDREGIIDNGSAISVGRISWAEISHLQPVVFLGNTFLGVSLSESEAVLSRQHPFKRLMLRANCWLVGFPVNIPQTMLPIPVPDVLLHIRDRLGVPPRNAA